MGKDSLLKSTSKKKGSPKKKGGERGAAATKTPAKAKTKKAAAKNAGRKAAPAAKAVNVQKAAPAPAAEKKAPPKKMSAKELLLQKFDRYSPVKPFASAPEKADPNRFASPPIVSSTDPKEAKRLKSLLLQKIDLEALAEAARKLAPAASEKSVAEEKQAAKPAKSATVQKPASAPETEPVAASAEATAPPKQTASSSPPANPPDHDVLEGFGGPAPFGKTTILAIVAFAMLVLLIVGASYSNTHKFYLKAKDGTLEIWQGAFAPMGEKKLVALPGVAVPAPTQAVYYKSEVFPLAFDYYIGQADALLDAPGLPDFEGIKRTLNRARKFAATSESEKMVRIRIDYIDLFIFRYKAEVSAAKGTVEDLDTAIGYLQEAERLTVNGGESEEITNRIETFQKLKAQISEAATAAKAEAASVKAEAEGAVAETEAAQKATEAQETAEEATQKESAATNAH